MAFRLLPEEPKSQESLLQKGGRIASQIGKEAAVTAVGLPGDVANLLNTFIAAPVTKALGGKPVSYEETYLGKILPTSSQHRETLEKGIPYLKPKNKLEQFVADVTTDATSLLLPTKTKIPFKNTLTKAFSTSLGANVLGDVVKDITGDEKKAAYTKMGSLFGLSLLNKPAAAKYVESLYGKAAEALPKDAVVDASRLEKSLEKLKSTMLSGRSESALAPSEKFVVDEANKVLGMIEDGTINVNTAWAAKRSLNENLQGIYKTLPEKSGRVRAKSFASKINHDLRETIKEYGKKNPEFYKNFSSADEAFGTIAQSNYISRFIPENLRHSPVTHGLAHILGIGTSAIGVGIPYQATKILHRIYKSPTLRNYYQNVLKAAVQEDALTMNKELSKLDRALQKEEKNSNYKYRLLN